MCKVSMTCDECNASLTGGKSGFCGNVCKSKWNNRRRARGAELLDIFMTMRHDRPKAARMKEAGDNPWTLACRLAKAWHDEDVAAGRKSFHDIEEIMKSGKWSWTKAVKLG